MGAISALMIVTGVLAVLASLPPETRTSATPGTLLIVGGFVLAGLTMIRDLLEDQHKRLKQICTLLQDQTHLPGRRPLPAEASDRADKPKPESPPGGPRKRRRLEDI